MGGAHFVWGGALPCAGLEVVALKTLVTQRLVLRPWRMDDCADFYAYASDPRVGPDAGWEPHANPGVSQEILLDFIRKDEVWALELRETGRCVGSIGLHADPKRNLPDGRMLGYVLAPAQWGRGLVTEAAQRVVRFGFEEMGLEMLSAIHFPHNAASARVIQKCGFVYEGTFRRAFLRYDGVVLDEVCYSLLREEYEQHWQQ